MQLAPHHLFTKFFLPLATASLGASVTVTGAVRVAIERGTPLTNELLINAVTRGCFLFGIFGVGAGLAIERYYSRQSAATRQMALKAICRRLQRLEGADYLSDEARAEIVLLREELSDEGELE